MSHALVDYELLEVNCLIDPCDLWILSGEDGSEFLPIIRRKYASELREVLLELKRERDGCGGYSTEDEDALLKKIEKRVALLKEAGLLVEEEEGAMA